MLAGSLTRSPECLPPSTCACVIKRDETNVASVLSALRLLRVSREARSFGPLPPAVQSRSSPIWREARARGSRGRQRDKRAWRRRRRRWRRRRWPRTRTRAFRAQPTERSRSDREKAPLKRRQTRSPSLFIENIMPANAPISSPLRLKTLQSLGLLPPQKRTAYEREEEGRRKRRLFREKSPPEGLHHHHRLNPTHFRQRDLL